jgi:hypothetical protein
MFRRLRWLPFLTVFSGCATTLQSIPADWMSVPQTTPIRSVALASDGTISPSSQPDVLTVPKGSIRATSNAIGPMIVNGDKALTESFLELDSFDLSESRGEVVFSVKRDDDFDIGLVAVEGSPISWVPPDPADEVAVKWAPRGSKISYIIRSKFSDVVRTLHIPTSASFAVDFPFSHVQALGWDAAGERFAVAYSSPIAADAVDVMKYSGEARTTPVKPSATLDFSIEPFAGDAIVLQRTDIRYNEKLPLVVWVARDRLAWNDARAELLRNARVALVITSRIDDSIWQRARETAWIDSSRRFVVSGGEAIVPVERGRAGSPVVHIVSDETLPTGRYRREGNVVTVAPAVVESFAARFIADQLKRTSPP